MTFVQAVADMCGVRVVILHWRVGCDSYDAVDVTPVDTDGNARAARACLILVLRETSVSGFVLWCWLHGRGPRGV